MVVEMVVEDVLVTSLLSVVSAMVIFDIYIFFVIICLALSS